jgi:hypothetical protein
MLYNVHTLDIINDEINDEHSTNDNVELPENPSVQDVCRELRKCDRMKPGHKSRLVTLEEDGDNYIVSYKGQKRLKLVMNPVHDQT